MTFDLTACPGFVSVGSAGEQVVVRVDAIDEALEWLEPRTRLIGLTFAREERAFVVMLGDA